jgi:pyruvate/2-oxoglutarate dehydrogenase complex dihydrolipoamide dehydrogenase (E3) component
MTEPRTYDAIVVGTGQAGKPLAKSLGESGLRTAIVERDDKVGGSCVVYGCTPTKTLVASARVAHLARRAPDYGVMTGPVSVDMTRVRERKRSIVETFSGGSRKGLERQENVELIFGEASFTGPRTMRVDDGLEITADKIFLNTGTRPAIPSVPGLSDVPFLTSGSLMELADVPEHLLIVGGGYIGVEFGQMFRRFGARVTIVQRAAHLLAREDDDISAAVLEIFQEDGIEVCLSSTLKRVSRDGEGRTSATVDTPDGERQLDVSEILLAAGRAPNSDRLNLAAAGVDADERGFIPVNDRLETNVSGIWALGDIVGGPAFTHISYDDYRIVEANVLHAESRSTAGRVVPYTVFMDPELGRVGLSEREARQRGLDYQVAKMPMKHVARAMESDETRGFMKAIVDRDSEKILGCAILGVAGGEIMTVLQVAMAGGLPYTAIRDGVFAHPTFSESLNILFHRLTPVGSSTG